MEGRELRRSYTQIEFPVGMNRSEIGAKHQVRTNKKHITPNRMKFPTLEIYRPPGQRIMQELVTREGGAGVEEGASTRFNVHAKEFVMNNNTPPLQTSKSTGNILFHHGEGKRGIRGGGMLMNNRHQLQQQHSPVRTSYMAHSVLKTSSTQTQIQTEQPEQNKPKAPKEETKGLREPAVKAKEGTELRRSKSLYVASTNHNNNVISSNFNHISLLRSRHVSPTVISGSNILALKGNNQLPVEIAHLLGRTQTDVGQCTLGELAQMARSLVEKASEERAYAEKLAEACIAVIEREPHSTFLEALLNSIIFSIEKRLGDPGKNRSHALLAFLSHLYTMFKTVGKCAESKMRAGGGPNPSLQMLFLLAQCCVCLLRNPNSVLRNEVECLFFVVTTIGRELEQETPRLLEEIMESMRDVLYSSHGATEPIRKTLLQILELNAAKWQMPAESLLFYQSSSA